ncbi:MAG TPA: LysR family transcriptional regulator, partial [Thermodesulfobacteriota bacterium]
MDLRKLRYFVHVAELGGFGRAARSLGVAQPALSRHVRDLERELGVRLLHRNGRGVLLTDAGMHLLPRAK